MPTGQFLTCSTNDTSYLMQWAAYIFLKKWANRGLFLFIFILLLLQFQCKLKKSVDCVLGIRTRGCRMVGVDETTELWRPPMIYLSLILSLSSSLIFSSLRFTFLSQISSTRKCKIIFMDFKKLFG